MEFPFSEKQKLIRETARSFVHRKVIPHVRAWEEKGAIPQTVIEKMAELGFFGIPIPEAPRGAGLEYVSFALVVEEIARGCNSLRTTLSVQISLTGLTLLASGTST